MNDIIRTLQFEKEQLEARIRLLENKLDSDNRQISEYDHELRQAKRLLKAAVEDMNINDICDDVNICNVCTEKNCISCDAFHWRYPDEALALIGGYNG